MTYTQRVKASKEIIERMEGLLEDGKFTFKYKNQTYQLRCYSVYEDGRQSFSINKLGGYESMNVYTRFGSKLGPTSLELYTYDMMNQRSTYKMDMSLMEILTPKGLPKEA